MRFVGRVRVSSNIFISRWINLHDHVLEFGRVQMGRSWLGIESARQPVLGQVRGSGDPVHSNILRFEEGSKPVVFFLPNRIVLVIVTACASHCESEKRGAGVL